MRKLYLLPALFLLEIPVQSTAQPFRIDLSGGVYLGTDLMRVSVPGYESGFAYVAAGAILNARISYFIGSVGFSPMINVSYNWPGIGLDPNYVNTFVLTSNGFMLDAGVEKSFQISYSMLRAGVGMGYDWQSYEVDEPQRQKVNFTNNDVEYWSGLSLYLPFIKGVDLTLGYRLVFKKKQAMEQQGSDFSDRNYRLETSELRHLFTVGVSFELMKKKQK